VPQPVHLTLLGGFDLRLGRRLIQLAPGSERVVAYVALHNGPASRANVAGNLWSDMSEERALANLRSALWRMRRPGVSIIESHGDRLSLASHVAVDFIDLRSAARGLLDGRVSGDNAQLDRLVAGGDLLADWYDDWVFVEREHFRQLRLQALEQMAFEFAASMHFGRAAETALAAVATEPLRESAHRALIAVHLAQGNRTEAIRQYCVYRRLVRDELDLEPSKQMDDLIGSVPPPALERAIRVIAS
jgi:DNA-binding SARP family transcriptional activator